MAGRVEAEGLVGELIVDGDDEAAGVAAPEECDVEAVGGAVAELCHGVCSLRGGGRFRSTTFAPGARARNAVSLPLAVRATPRCRPTAEKRRYHPRHRRHLEQGLS